MLRARSSGEEAVMIGPLADRELRLEREPGGEGLVDELDGSVQWALALPAGAGDAEER